VNPPFQSFPKRVLVLLALLIFSTASHAMTLEDISPHISTNANIIWLADTNLLPKSIWTYRKLPQTFSQNTVSNILPLCGFQMNPFPKSFKKQITLWDNVIEGDPRPDYFAVVPELGFISFARERRPTASGEASTNALVQRTWQYAQLIGLDKTSRKIQTRSKAALFHWAERLMTLVFWTTPKGFAFDTPTPAR